MTCSRLAQRIVALVYCVALAAAANAQSTVKWVDSFRDLTPKKIEPIDAPFAMPKLARPVFPGKTFNIRDYGAVADGVTTNTAAIAKAIATAAKAGGGTVLVPAGRWLTGPIRLDNNINLHLDKGATVLFSQKFSDYLPAVFTRHEGVECYSYSPFIYADGKTNIAVTGQGVLDGQGQPWWDLPGQGAANSIVRRMGEDGTPLAQRVFDGSGENGGLRPPFFQPVRCKNVLVEGVEFRFGAFWTITPCYCDNVIVRGVKVHTFNTPQDRTPNGDGVDPDSCRNMLIEYCDLDTGDDCIAIKSGKDRDGLAVARPTENVVVRKIRAWRGHGGITCGSEVSGGVRNIYGYDCVFDGTDRGLRFKTNRGRGGAIENVWCDNIAIGTVAYEAIEMTMLYTGRRLPAWPVGPGTPTMRNMHFKNVSCKNAKREMILIAGLPERAIEDVTIENCKIGGQRPVLIDDAKNVTLRDVTLAPAALPAFDILDSWNVGLKNVDVTKPAPGTFVAPEKSSMAKPVARKSSTRKSSTRKSSARKSAVAKPAAEGQAPAVAALPVTTFLNVKGKATHDVVVTGGNLAQAGADLATFSDDAAAASVTVKE